MKANRIFFVIVIFISLLFFLSSVRLAVAQADFYYRFSPTAIYNDGQDSTTLEVYTSGRNIASVTIKPEYGDSPILQLYDDGSHGDVVAGDGVYSLAGITPAMFPDDVLFPMMYDENDMLALANIWLLIEVAYSGGAGSDFIYGAGIQVVADDIQFPAQAVGDGLFATEYAFFIVDPAGETYSGSFPNITDYHGPTIAKKFYSVYPDDFDFINFMVVRGDLGMKAHSGGLRDPAKNIGRDRVDYTAEYGSRGRLLTMSYSDFVILNHEIGHTWAAFLGEQQGISNGVHWTGNTDISGIMSEGFETSDGLYFFRPNEDGTFKAGYSGDTFSPLELYLMGMLPPEEVPDVHVLINPDLSNLERVTAQSVETYPIEDIMALAGGVREPAYPNAQTEFNLAMIFLSDSTFSPAELAWFTYQSQCYMAHNDCGQGNFFYATGGRGTVNTRLADWGIPNVQSSVPASPPPETAQITPPTGTSVPAQTAITAPVVDTSAVPETTETRRPEFKIPICNTLLTPAIAGIGWLLRSLVV